ncbi:restriction endonuclease subunit S [Campylobacter upsaliensis]|nr:restriction endonuclease subunit S [Campylobacter upsaliensis]
MKTDTLKKSLLDYAIKGRLSAKFRRENSGLNAFDELEIYNDNIKQKRKDLEKKLKICEKELKKAPTRHCETSAGSRGNLQSKQELKSQIQILKKEIAKCKEITPLNLSEAPFEIPNTWAWVKLGDICEIFTGNSINATEKEKNFTHQTSGLNYIATKDLANDTSITYENGIKIPDEFLPSFKIAKANSTLLCIEGGSAGRKVGFLKENVCFGNKLCCFENIFAFSKFVFYFLQSGEFSKEFNSNINGIIGGVKKESIRHFLIPLPPLCEQQEIVKKLDLLVTLANDFAITKENLKRIEKRIEKSLLKLALEGSLSKLYRRSSPTLSAFDEINTYNEAIKEKRKDLEKELKKCEKEFKLEKDKDKKALCKSQIQMLKKELTKCKEIIPLMTMDCHEVANATSHNDDLGYSSSSLRGEAEANHTPKTANRLPQVSSETLAMTTTPPFTIPNSWAWVKLGDICEIVSGGTPSRDKIEYWHNGTIPWVKIADVKNNVVNQTQEFITELGLENSSAKIFKKGTLLYTIFATLGETAILNIDAATNQAIAALIEAYDYDTKFLMYCLMSMKDYVNSLGRGVAQNNINQTMLKNFSIPLPPLCEQEHIVQTLDTLFTLKKGLRVD